VKDITWWQFATTSDHPSFVALLDGNVCIGLSCSVSNEGGLFKPATPSKSKWQKLRNTNIKVFFGLDHILLVIDIFARPYEDLVWTWIDHAVSTVSLV
jgi:hypothetical protein